MAALQLWRLGSALARQPLHPLSQPRVLTTISSFLKPVIAIAPIRGISSALLSQLDVLEKHHSALQNKLMNGADPKELAKLGRELASLERVMSAATKWKKLANEVVDLTALLKDGEANAGDPSTCASGATEIVQMARAELQELQPQLDDAEDRLIRMLLPRDEADSRDAILELRAGVGGEEACLFASEMMRLYEQYAVAKGWEWAPMTIQKEENYGGIREAVIAISGAGAFGRIRHESGVHRVQRIPITQSTGKLQTSTMTVAVLPEAEEVDFALNPSELKIETYRAGGAGGQHVNKTESAVRIIHVPTGVVVAIQDERSQQMNRVKAMRVLRARLYEAERERIASARSKERKSQIGTSARSDRVRTYNFAQNRVTDHRCNISKFDVDRFMRGEDMDEVFDTLDAQLQEEQLAALEEAAASTGENVGRRGRRATKAAPAAPPVEDED